MYTSGGRPLTQYIDGQWYDTFYSAHGSRQTTMESQRPSSNFPPEGRLEDAVADFPREGRQATVDRQRGGSPLQLLAGTAVEAAPGRSAAVLPCEPQRGSTEPSGMVVGRD